ncbi:MAG: hypothetical protein F2681_15145 [Actinobacteria bacterium]|nr:hypothetical protein [Actinomycetota bacterium]MSW78901.1 hypothetical protein [Actinomycetota bacterium]MSX54057.1 hypothetical protein [Actinomycetota bacterium]MSX94108.1 hypothetical protein [Actinomycetota bacterium]MSZ84470.1 hypothetical protein [Actinomycetota bacterium]
MSIELDEYEHHEVDVYEDQPADVYEHHEVEFRDDVIADVVENAGFCRDR